MKYSIVDSPRKCRTDSFQNLGFQFFFGEEEDELVIMSEKW